MGSITIHRPKINHRVHGVHSVFVVVWPKAAFIFLDGFIKEEKDRFLSIRRRASVDSADSVVRSISGASAHAIASRPARTVIANE